MNYLPLPDEILRKIYQYIHPIFEYKKYIDSVKDYKEISKNFSEMIYTHDERMLFGDIKVRIDSCTEMASLSNLQIKYLAEIDNFIKKNPLFLRPVVSNNLTPIQYKRQFDIHISINNLKRLEKNLCIRRGEWFHPNKRDEINVYNDINVLHKSGTIRDLIFACMMNNVRGWKTSFGEYMLKKYFINTSISKVYEIHYINFVNYYYSEENIQEHNSKYVPERSKLIKKLMKL